MVQQLFLDDQEIHVPDVSGTCDEASPVVTIGLVGEAERLGFPLTALGGRLDNPPTVATVLAASVFGNVDLYCDI